MGLDLPPRPSATPPVPGGESARTFSNSPASQISNRDTTVQNPSHLNQYNEPQPDILLVKPRDDYCASKHPTAEDTFLLLEVADTSLKFDLKVKIPLYARMEVPEGWVADLRENVIQVFRNPKAGQFQTVLTIKVGDSFSVLAFPDVDFSTSDLIG